MPMVDIDWLKDHVEVPEGLTYEQLAKDLVKVGLEEEEIHTSQLVGPIVVGYVVDATPEPQKNGKIINWCHVDVGDEYNETDENGNKVPRGIICGAPNMAAGEKVVVTQQRLVQVQQVHGVVARLECLVLLRGEAVLAKQDDTVMIVAEAQFSLGGAHAVGDVAVSLARFDLEIAR